MDKSKRHKKTVLNLLEKKGTISKNIVNKENPKILVCMEEFLKKNDLDVTNFGQSLWHYVHTQKNIPQCYCGKTLKYKNFKIGYGEFCSRKCTNNDKKLTEKKKSTLKKTNILNHGVEHTFQREDVKTKSKETLINNHGVSTPLMCVEIKNKKIDTTLKKYGVEYATQNETLKEKIKNNNLKKYGTTTPNQTEEIKKKNTEHTISSVLKKYGVKNVYHDPNLVKQIKDKYDKKINENFLKRYGKYDVLSIGSEIEIKCPKKHNFKINKVLLESRDRLGYEVCTVCNPINSGSQVENKLKEFFKNLGVECVFNDRGVLNGKELDVYIPKHNLAIEFNGLYWHNELFKDKDYHLNKTNECKEKSIDLIHIFEDEWLYKEDIVKSIIKNRLNMTENKLYARKCVIKEVPLKQSKEFLDKNHILGKTNCFSSLGLYYEGELISIMTFTKRFGNIELSRFCNKLNTTVVGGASKLFKYFLKTHKETEIVSYSDIRMYSGLLYEKLGFEGTVISKPTYFYVSQTNRLDKRLFRKDKLIKDGYNGDLTEHEIMLSRTMYRIYDCGKQKWVFTY